MLSETFHTKLEGLFGLIDPLFSMPIFYEYLWRKKEIFECDLPINN